jgi:dihydroorotate dehydrogenase
MLYENILKPLLFKMDAEEAHHFTLSGLQKAERVPGAMALLEKLYGTPTYPELAVQVGGLEFANPIGLAAGLDKNAAAVKAFSAIGFGFMEVGTVTPQPQAGNERPRLFRLPTDSALINRMGFNNIGAKAMAANLRRLSIHTIPVGINIGKNKATPNERAADDYRECLRMLYPYGDFFVVNISSPNTPDLRNLQHGDELRTLLAAVTGETERLARDANAVGKPIFVKIAPD